MQHLKAGQNNHHVLFLNDYKKNLNLIIYFAMR